MNRVLLSARVVEISTLRYTPSGLPMVDIKLEHESTVEDNGIHRKINLILKSLVKGALAEKLTQLNNESIFKFDGFLASAINSKSIVFHIQSFQTDS